MDPSILPQDEKEFEELVQLLESYEARGTGGLGPMPEELQELMANVKRARGQQASAQQATQEVTPQPGYVIKTADESQRKVFINICHSSQVPAPSSWGDGMAPEKVLKALEDMQHNQPNTDAEAMRFALSVSDLQPDTDKQGQACVTVDVVINNDVMQAVQQTRPLKAFVNELAVGYVSQKHKLQLDPKYKLPKMNYKGSEIRSQRIKMDPKPLVSDVTSTRDNDEPSFPLVPSKAAAAAKKAKAAAAANKAKAAAAAATPAAGGSQPSTAAGRAAAEAAAAVSSSGSCCSWQHDVTCEGRPVTQMVVTVQLPVPSGGPTTSGNGSSSSSGWPAEAVKVQLCGTQLKVALDCMQKQGHQQTQQQQQQQEPSAVCIHLPFAASSDGAAAELHATSGRLTVQLPYLPLQQWVQQLEHEAPTAFSKLPVAHEAYMELDE